MKDLTKKPASPLTAKQEATRALAQVIPPEALRITGLVFGISCLLKALKESQISRYNCDNLTLSQRIREKELLRAVRRFTSHTPLLDLGKVFYQVHTEYWKRSGRREVGFRTHEKLETLFKGLILPMSPWREREVQALLKDYLPLEKTVVFVSEDQRRQCLGGIELLSLCKYISLYECFTWERAVRDNLTLQQAANIRQTEFFQTAVNPISEEDREILVRIHQEPVQSLQQKLKDNEKSY